MLRSPQFLRRQKAKNASSLWKALRKRLLRRLELAVLHCIVTFMTYLVNGTTPVSIQAGGRYFWTGRRLGEGCSGHLYSGLEIKEHKEYHILAPRLTGNTQFSVFREQTLQTLLKERNVICVNQN